MQNTEITVTYKTLKICKLEAKELFKITGKN